jgi:hypothetical protein
MKSAKCLVNTLRPVLLVTVLSLLAANLAQAATIVEGPIFDPYADSDLYVLSPSSWSVDEAAAQSLGGNLVTINSAAENTFVVDDVLQDFSSSGGPNLSDLPLWIGLYDPEGAVSDDGPGGPNSQHAANFEWVNGSGSTYRYWNSGEPNDETPGEYYTVIDWNVSRGDGPATLGTWNDTPDAGTTGFGGNTDGPYYGIAEVSVPEPSTLALLAAGFVLHLGVRRVRKGALRA